MDPMNALPSAELRRAIEALWRAGKLTPGNLYATPTFISLRKVCKTNYPRGCYEPAASVGSPKSAGGFVFHAGRSLSLRPSDSWRNGFIAGALRISFLVQKGWKTSLSNIGVQADAQLAIGS